MSDIKNFINNIKLKKINLERKFINQGEEGKVVEYSKNKGIQKYTIAFNEYTIISYYKGNRLIQKEKITKNKRNKLKFTYLNNGNLLVTDVIHNTNYKGTYGTDNSLNYSIGFIDELIE